MVLSKNHTWINERKTMNTDQLIFNTLTIAVTLSMIVGVVIYVVLQYTYSRRETELLDYINQLEERLEDYQCTR